MSVAPELDAVSERPFIRCRNCAAPVDGQYCSTCGQAAVQRDRVTDLAVEWSMACERPDGILWSTMGLLILNPGRLTTDWWHGRRTLRMSPVRTLFAVVVLGSILTVAQTWLYPGAGGTVGPILQLFTFQTAVVGSLVTIAMMPRLLPMRLSRSLYQHVAFALYESAFLGLAACLMLALLVASGAAPAALGMIGFMLAPLVVPALFLAIAAHATAHIRFAYGVSWPGAVGRVALLGVLTLIASGVASMVVQATGLFELLVPLPDS